MKTNIVKVYLLLAMCFSTVNAFCQNNLSAELYSGLGFSYKFLNIEESGGNSFYNDTKSPLLSYALGGRANIYFSNNFSFLIDIGIKKYGDKSISMYSGDKNSLQAGQIYRSINKSYRNTIVCMLGIERNFLEKHTLSLSGGVGHFFSSKLYTTIAYKEKASETFTTNLEILSHKYYTFFPLFEVRYGYKVFDGSKFKIYTLLSHEHTFNTFKKNIDSLKIYYSITSIRIAIRK